MPWVLIEGRAYWSVFAAAFVGIALWESRRRFRALGIPEERRWPRHAMMMLSGYAAVFLVCRISPVVTAAWAGVSGLRVLGRLGLPVTARWIVALLVLDFVRYAVHRAHHSLPVLWRVHRVHHSDPDYDVSTAARFHPIETVVTQLCTLTAIAALSPPLGAVLCIELATCFQSFFVHANASLPGWVERPLRLVWLTPDVHRIHHAEDPGDQQSNFGEIFPWWDRMLGTYRAEATAGRDRWVPGLAGFQDDRSLEVWFMLTSPFRRERERSEK